MRQSGMALVEALVASSLLGLGLLGASRLTLRALDAAMQTRQQEQARMLARDTLDCVLARTSPCPAAERVTRQGVAYKVQLQSTPLGQHLHEVSVRVEWQVGAEWHQRQWRTRSSALPDWLGVSSP